MVAFVRHLSAIRQKPERVVRMTPTKAKVEDESIYRRETYSIFSNSDVTSIDKLWENSVDFFFQENGF